MQMRLAGLSVSEIARDLGVTPGRVSQLLREAIDEIKTEERADAEILKALQQRDLMAAISVVRKSLSSDDPAERLAAADRLVKLWGRLSKFEGLDAPDELSVHEKVITVELKREEQRSD